MKYWITWTSTPESLDMGGAPPHTDILIRPATCGRCPNQTVFKNNTLCARSLSLESLEPLKTNTSCFRNCALQRAPVRWTLALKPTIWRSPRPCQSVTSRSNEFNDCRGKLPRCRQPATSRYITCFQTRAIGGTRTNHVVFRNNGPKQHVELTRENKTKGPACLNQQKASNELSIPNSNWNW